jgi:excisionase family DNA binding protein
MTADQLLTPKQAGDRLAVSYKTVQRRVYAGEIAWVNIAPAGARPRIRISESALAAYERRQQRGPA